MTLGLFQNIGPMEVVVILVIALLLFGSRLPQVGRSLGKGIVEFKKGIKGIEDEVESASSGKGGEAGRLPGESSFKAQTPGDERRISRAEGVEAGSATKD